MTGEPIAAKQGHSMTAALTTEPVQTEDEKPNDTAVKSPVPFKVGLNEAARLTGASKTTILKYAEEGKLSFEFNGAQKKVYQVAELQRVFGDLKVQNGSAKGQQDQSEPEQLAENTAVKVAQLEGEVAKLQAVLEAEREKSRILAEVAEKAELNADHWRGQADAVTRMLTHTPTATPEPEPPAASPKKKFLGIFGGR